MDFLSQLDNATDVSSVTEYSVWIGSGEVRVRIFDHGGAAEHGRYQVDADWAVPDPVVVARGGTTRQAGNPDSSLAVALANVHWRRFQPDAE